MKGFKGFDKNMRCLNVQYVEGKTYEVNEAVLCEIGFHFCENPLDVFNYYPNCAGNIFCEIVAEGKITEKKGDTKRACTKITIGKRLSLQNMIEEAFIFYSATSGYSANSVTSGDFAHSATSGDFAHSATSGKNSIACALGNKAKAKSVKNNWLVLAEYDNSHNIVCVKTVEVDGKKIKENVWYELKNGEFLENNE